jgi:hypothetical protein
LASEAAKARHALGAGGAVRISWAKAEIQVVASMMV